MSVDVISGDRRANHRYQCAMNLRFERTNPTGEVQIGYGVTADLSREALRFSADEAVEVGTELVTHLDWPFLLQNICRLELILTGSVQAVTRRGVILKIRSYEFRTCGERSFWEAPPTSSSSKVA
jgi:hypothetical protein